jgi:hypothetical protein
MNTKLSLRKHKPSNVRLFNAAKVAANEYREQVRNAGFPTPSLQDATNDLVIAGAEALGSPKPSASGQEEGERYE